MNSAPHSREAWTNADLAQRTEHTLEFDEGIIEEFNVFSMGQLAV